MSWNICSLRKRAPELIHLINLHTPAVVLLQETLLYSEVESPAFQGYILLRKDRPNSTRGGVAILIKDDIPYTLMEIKNSNLTEVIAVKVPCNDSELAIASIYVPPSKGRYKTLKTIYDQLGDFFITAGDFNAHNTLWGAAKTNSTGRYVERLVTLRDSRLHLPPSPTRIHPNNPEKDAVLDFCVSHSTLEEIKIQVIADGSSDHKPVLMSLPDYLTIFNPNNLRLITNWDGIRVALSQIQWPEDAMPTISDIDKSVQLLKSHIQVAMLNNTKGIRLKNNYSRLIPKDIHRLIKRKRRAQHKFNSKRNSDIKTKIKKTK